MRFGFLQHGLRHGRGFGHGPGPHDHGDRESRAHRGGRFGGDRHGGERGGRLGRFFEHGDLRLVILALIAEKPRHGYEIIKAIEERVGGAYSPSPGVVYPTLTLLEEIGHVTIEAGQGAKKLHTITPDGQRFLDANATSVKFIFDRMDEAGAARASADLPQVVRGMENLKMALRLRASRGPLTEQQARTIAAALDAAAIAIEQS